VHYNCHSGDSCCVIYWYTVAHFINKTVFVYPFVTLTSLGKRRPLELPP